VSEFRTAWRFWQAHLHPHRLVFIDETGANTKMTRRYGRTFRGQRLVAKVPHGHWKTTTFVGALRATGITAALVAALGLHTWPGFVSRSLGFGN